MMARWMIFRWWSAAKSCRNGRIIRISARGGIAPCAFTRCASVSPSMYAITTYAVPFCSNKSSRGTSGGQFAFACRKRYPRTNRAQYRAKSAAPLGMGCTLPSAARTARARGKNSFTATTLPRAGASSCTAR